MYTTVEKLISFMLTSGSVLPLNVETSILIDYAFQFAKGKAFLGLHKQQEKTIKI